MLQSSGLLATARMDLPMEVNRRNKFTATNKAMETTMVMI